VSLFRRGSRASTDAPFSIAATASIAALADPALDEATGSIGTSASGGRGLRSLTSQPASKIHFQLPSVCFRQIVK
jgi:hypothetical protein